MRYSITRAAAALPLLLLAGRPALAQSQSRWSLEATGDAAIPTRTLAGADLKTGGGFGANARYRFMPHLAAYAGWEWHLQQTEQLLAGETLDLNDNGYTLGLRFEHPLVARTAGWLRAGGLANHIEIENADGVIIQDTGHGLGWEVGGGLTFPIAPRFALMPGVRYRTLSSDVEFGGSTKSSTLSYVTMGIGLAYTF
jgi:hypothetical protein